jgi:hypothetical protein
MIAHLLFGIRKFGVRFFGLITIICSLAWMV